MDWTQLFGTSEVGDTALPYEDPLLRAILPYLASRSPDDEGTLQKMGPEPESFEMGVSPIPDDYEVPRYPPWSPPQDTNLLRALYREYPEYEALQQYPSKPGWGPYFDETYWGLTPQERERKAGLDKILSQLLGFGETMDLTRDQWLDQVQLAKIENDYAAQAGKSPSNKAGYFMESPEIAQENALRNAWMDALAQRGYNPHAQQATSSSPQFGGVYVDPMMKGEQETGNVLGGHAPLRRTEYNPFWQSFAELPSKSTFSRALPTGTLPEMPAQVSNMKGLNKYLEALTTKEEKAKKTAEKEYYKIGAAEAKMVGKAQREETTKAEKEKGELDQFIKKAQGPERAEAWKDIKDIRAGAIQHYGYSPDKIDDVLRKARKRWGDDPVKIARLLRAALAEGI